jgi:hypothetical protein
LKEERIDSSDDYDAQEAWTVSMIQVTAMTPKKHGTVSKREPFPSPVVSNVDAKTQKPPPEHWTRTLSPNKVRKEGGVGDQPVGAYVRAPKAPEASFSTTLKNPPLENVATTEFARKYAKEEACNRKFTKFPIPPFSMIKTSTRGGMHG